MKAKRLPESDFMPDVTEKGEYLVTVEAANEAIRKYLAEKQSAEERKPQWGVALPFVHPVRDSHTLCRRSSQLTGLTRAARR
jgi:hypothetical protein